MRRAGPDLGSEVLYQWQPVVQGLPSRSTPFLRSLVGFGSIGARRRRRGLCIYI